MRQTIILFFLLIFLHPLVAQHQPLIQRMEPPNWWVGMHKNEVEVMFYGEKIAQYEPSLKAYTGVSLVATSSPANPNYLFLKICIGPDAVPGKLSFVFSENGKKSFTQAYPLLSREQGRESIEGFDTSDAIYLITPDRFVNGDTSNDQVPAMIEKSDRSFSGGRHGGDITGIQNSLDYIKDLGFTAVWSNPLLENNMENYSYHGYSTTDFYKVDPRFGSNALFKKLCDQARQRDIKVIMDMIVNHCGLAHWWMKDLPSKDWINQWPEYTGTNHRKTVILDPYSSSYDLRRFTDGWFVPSMPDLNQRNPFLATYLIQNSIWWIEYSGISGIRMDTYSYPDMNFMSDWTNAVMEEYPNFTIVGEEWVIRPTIVSYWQKGKDNPNGYTSDLKSLMDFPLQNALVTSLTNKKAWSSPWQEVYETLGQDYLYPDPENLVVFADNHDMSRIFTQVNEDVDLLKLALVYIATVRGIPEVYYGTEIGMKNPGTTDHGVIRSDFPGGWEEDSTSAFTGKGLSKEQKDIQNFVKRLFSWRKTASTIHDGRLMHFAPNDQDECYVFFRYDDSQTYMIILNRSSDETTFGFDQYQEITGPVISGHDVLSGLRLNRVDKITIQGKTAMILQLDQ